MHSLHSHPVLHVPEPRSRPAVRGAQRRGGVHGTGHVHGFLPEQRRQARVLRRGLAPARRLRRRAFGVQHVADVFVLFSGPLHAGLPLRGRATGVRSMWMSVTTPDVLSTSRKPRSGRSSTRCRTRTGCNTDRRSDPSSRPGCTRSAPGAPGGPLSKHPDLRVSRKLRVWGLVRSTRDLRRRA